MITLLILVRKAVIGPAIAPSTPRRDARPRAVPVSATKCKLFLDKYETDVASRLCECESYDVHVEISALKLSTSDDVVYLVKLS